MHKFIINAPIQNNSHYSEQAPIRMGKGLTILTLMEQGRLLFQILPV